jgi:hypothetical protein
MLTVEMKINGTMIGQIYAHNEGGALGNCDYKWHCYLMDDAGKPSLYEGRVNHQRQEGFAKLMSIIYEDLLEKKK